MHRFLLLALLSSLVAAADTPIDLSSADRASLIGKQFTVPLLTTENTVTFTIGTQPCKVQLYCVGSEWGASRATGAFSTKADVLAGVYDTVKVMQNPGASGTGTMQFFVQTKTAASDTLIVVVTE